MSSLQYVSFCGTYVSILRSREVSISNHNPRLIAVTAIGDNEAVVKNGTLICRQWAPIIG